VALTLPAALEAGRARAGDSPQAVLAAARAVLDPAPLTVDYLALVDAQTFEPAAGPGYTGTALLLVAARVGGTRLIDNVIVGFGK
jgi:pantoate--beta-alanine ligase